MKSIYNVYEASLLGDIEDTLEYGDVVKEDMYKFQWEYAYLSNLPDRNLRAVKGGMREIYRKYFIKNVPKLETDRYSTLQTLIKYPERKHILNKLDTDGDYIASYMLQCKFDRFVDFYDFTNESNKKYLEKVITEHMSKILNDVGKRNLVFNVEQYFHGGNQKIITIIMSTTDKNDFKPNVPRYNTKYYTEIMKFNFTKGQYYYK